MKKFLIFLLLFIMMFPSLFCSAEEIVIEGTHCMNGLSQSYHTWEEYEELLASGGKAGKGFVPYEQVSVFGEFYSLDMHYSDRMQPVSTAYRCHYTTMDENDFLIGSYVTKTNDEKPADLDNADLSSISDLRSLKGTAYENGDGELYIEGLCFFYDDDDLDLRGITFYYKDRYYQIGGVEQLCDYPRSGSNTLMMRLLDSKTTKSAIKELYAQLDKIDRGPFSLSDWLQKPPVLVGIGTVSGAVVATLITLLAVRKKRGAPAPAMAGVPTGEVSAGSDGDASTATVAAAPASPESPAPPEEDTKTDTPGRS